MTIVCLLPSHNHMCSKSFGIGRRHCPSFFPRNDCEQKIGTSFVYLIDLFMGLFRGAVFDHGGVPKKRPISLNGAFCPLNGPFSDLNGPLPRVPEWAVFPLQNPLENNPLRKGASRGFWLVSVLPCRARTQRNDSQMVRQIQGRANHEVQTVN